MTATPRSSNIGKIIISTNVTLDGVVEDPDGKEGTPFGGWFRSSVGNDFEAWSQREVEEAMHADALLLGKRSDAWFASRMATAWSTQWADRITSLPKYVVSSTSQHADLPNATLLRGPVVDRIVEVKRKHTGDILIYGSYQLCRTLMARDLVDELRLVVFPVVLGAGKRLFDDLGAPKALRLTSSVALGSALAFQSYELVRPTS